MAPTNRLIEARRAELRAEATSRKPSGTKTARTGAKRSTVQPKARAKSKA